jgi:hypothetical protein
MTMRTASGLTVLALLLGTALAVQGPAYAQEATVEEAAATAEDPALFSAEELDTLMAPIALYPDPLLAQVLLASTYPVDVLKADRFLSKNAGLDDKARSALAAEQEWPDPVREMTAAFPQLIARMAEHMDWTEQAGSAVVAQTDDVLASLQRLRAQAKLNGYLVDNEAMTVAEDEDTGSITISSKDPEVVYVPQYTETVYTQPAPATPIYVTDDDDWDDYLVTGAVVWGSAIIIDEIFDDDDWDNGWNHWYGGGGNGNGNSIDWDGDLNIDNGINIGNGNGNGNFGNGNFGNGNIGNGNLGNGNLGNGNIGNGNLGNGNLGNGNLGNGGLGGFERPTTLPGTLPGRLGDVDSDRLTNRKEGTFKPSDANRDVAREKIAKAKGTREGKGGVATLPAAKGKADLGKVNKDRKPEVKLPAKPKAGAAKDRKAKVAPEKLAKPKTGSRPQATKKVATSKKAPAYLPSTGNRGNAASSRGKKSLKGHR